MTEQPSTEQLIVDKQPTLSTGTNQKITISIPNSPNKYNFPTQSSLRLTDSHLNSTITPNLPHNSLTTDGSSSNSDYATCKNYRPYNNATNQLFPNDYEFGLFSCFENLGLCCLTMLCCHCLPIGLAAKRSECGPRSLCTLASFFCPCLVLQGVREVTRNQKQIPGTCAMDFCVNFCCCWCSACQLGRENGAYD